MRTLPESKFVFLFIFPTFNLLILSIYLFNFDMPGSKLFEFIFIMALSSFISICTIRSSLAILTYLRNFQISLFIIIFVFLILELLFDTNKRVDYAVIPFRQVFNFLLTKEMNTARFEMLEYLDESPFVKFKPNIVARSQRWRGSNNQFVYEWKTDMLGFKNLENISKLDSKYAVALGDSNTEGMGVPTSNTWPTVLSKNNYPTYNLGVQGYSPTQMKGSLKKYGLSMKPKFVIAAYTAGAFLRERTVGRLNPTTGERALTGGVLMIRDLNKLVESKKIFQAQYVFSAIYLSTITIRDQIYWLLTGKKSFASLNEFSYEIKPKFSSTFPYKNEFVHLTKNFVFKDFWSRPSGIHGWQEIAPFIKMLTAFEDIKVMSNSINAKMILVYLPHKTEICFERATGENRPNIYFKKLEAKLLQEFANENDIIFVNTEKKLMDYVNNLPDNFNIKSLPYLELDGHMSDVGHQLVAEEIMKTMKAQGD